VIEMGSREEEKMNVIVEALSGKTKYDERKSEALTR